jgi:hypothetical protein
VARDRVVIFLRNPLRGVRFWLADYLPALEPTEMMSAIVATITDDLRPVTAVPVPLPHDCVDGLFSAYWARPEMYLDADIRSNISNFALATEDDVVAGLRRLQRDLESGVWNRRYGLLRSLAELDLGHRLYVCELEGYRPTGYSVEQSSRDPSRTASRSLPGLPAEPYDASAATSAGSSRCLMACGARITSSTTNTIARPRVPGSPT